MAKKEFTFYGKTLDELKKMGHNEFAEYLRSRSKRSITRGFTEAQKRLITKLEKKGNNVKTHCRNMVILPMMVGKTIKVHNGKAFVPLTIQEEMLGHFVGEFVFTRNRVAHNSPGVGATRSSSSVSVK
ncbi:30S ribosomal protein S19 [Candidatus Woesearchaeota archaeon]|nr:30S ribosomal protein S19 [Candidatus Woesearchaeota archaeon]